MLPQTQQYFSNAVGSVLFVPDTFVYLHWSGEPHRSEELRALYTHTRNLLLRYRIHNILADHRAMPVPLQPADREWLLSEWLPDVAAHFPDARYAVLPSPDPAKRLHSDEVVRELRRYLVVRMFDDLEHATDWLKEPAA